MYSFQSKTKFRRDVRAAQKRGWNLDLLNATYAILAEHGALPPAYGSHPLRGDYLGCLDAHIRPDWVLIYEVIEQDKIVVLHRTGRHQDVFSNY